MSQLADALASINLEVTKFDPTKARPVSINDATISIDKFCKMVRERLGVCGVKYPEVFEASHSSGKMIELLTEYAKEEGILSGRAAIEVPSELEELTLNCNMAAKGRDDRFFLTYPDETVSPVSGDFYLLAHQMGPAEAVAASRHVLPEYMPRRGAGVREISIEGKKHAFFNMYVPPAWKRMLTKEQREKLPDKLPPLFDKLVKHLIPRPEEREFFFAWLHDSLFKRSFTFLILCGAPGTGKNRLKLVMRALHGHVNTVDGKKSTLTERFNSQLGEATLAWFDELKYDADMENVMKELQNDSISIERKGVDATKATKIHASIVISNNKPRDNHIAFDARKFVPLVVTPHRLEKSMTRDEIDLLTKKVEDSTKEEFDVKFLAQIAKWVKKHGPSKKWPNLEYHGPMFWTLAHTSMTRWQKKAVMLISELDDRTLREADSKKGVLWSSLQNRSQRKNGDRSLQFPDFTSIQAFFEVFRDGKGRKAFTTAAVPGNILGDFYVKPIFKDLEIISEASVTEQRGKASVQKETYDL